MDSISENLAFQEARLCKNCQALSFDDSEIKFRNITSDDRTEDFQVAHLDYEVHDSLPDLPVLSQSAKGGCDFCSLLRDTILSGDFYVDDILRLFMGGRQECNVRLALEYCRMEPRICHSNESPAPRMMILSALFYMESGKPDKQPRCPLMSFCFLIEGCEGHETVAQCLDLHSATSCADRLHHSFTSWAYSEIETCAAKHSHPDPTEGFSPARLLDVHSEPIRLVDHRHIQEAARNIQPPGLRYAALSYCWGNKDQSRQQPLTTRENISERSIGITEEQLTPVLRDAVLATRLLSLRFLWVDSLCILQGDRRDWEHQSAKMDEIYRNAFVTIATPASGFCGQGFRRASNKKLYVPFHSRVKPEARGVFSVRFLQPFNGAPHYRFESSDIYISDVNMSRWASRGWTFQEELMSTRVLLFGSAEVFFRCANHTSYKCGYRTSDHITGSHENLDWATWYETLSDYSSRSKGFSNPADILPGISGTAAAFGRQMQLSNEDYAAGLWKYDLFAGLGWHVQDLHAVKLRSLPELLGSLASPAVYISPSWTWPGKGRVEFLTDYCISGSLLSRCSIETRVTVKGDNPFGEVEGGVLRITGKVTELHSDLKLDDTSNVIRSMRHWILESEKGHPWRVHLDWDPLDDIVPREKLKMIVTGSGTSRNRGRKLYFGFLIHEIGPSPGTRYYRVGSFISSLLKRHPRHSAAQFLDRCETQTLDII